MLIVAAKVTLGPDAIEKLTPLAQKMAVETLKEPGCIEYAFSVDLSDPNLVRIFEKWESQAALDNHFTTPHMAEFQAGLADADVRGVEAKIYDIEGERDIGA